MKLRNVAIVLFLDKDFNIMVQDRKGVSKVGERYGFWGGEIEKGETQEEAIRREILEELAFTPKKLVYWKKFFYTVQEKGKYKDLRVSFHVFLSPITPELEKAEIYEGGGMLKMPFSQVLKGEGFPKGGSTEFLKYLPDFIKSRDLNRF